MSEFEATGGFAGLAEGGAAAGALTPDTIERVVGDFRSWLSELATPPSQLPAPVEEVDLFTLVGQFTALRHEVNLQTKAARAAVEQNSELIRHLAAVPRTTPPSPDEELRPLIKAVIDIADALSLSLNQMERLGDTVEPLLLDLLPAQSDELAEPPPPLPVAKPGFFARLFGSRDAIPTEAVEAAEEPSPLESNQNAALEEAVEKLRQLVAAAGDGYAMGLRRVERVLPSFGLETIAALGESFDPDLMEVVEVVEDPEVPSGTVVEEVRSGYRWRGKVFRFAQVKVAR